MRLVTKLVVGLILLGIVDIAIPIPIIGIMLMYVVLQKPSWFIELVGSVYNKNEDLS